MTPEKYRKIGTYRPCIGRVEDVTTLPLQPGMRAIIPVGVKVDVEKGEPCIIEGRARCVTVFSIRNGAVEGDKVVSNPRIYWKGGNREMRSVDINDAAVFGDVPPIAIPSKEPVAPPPANEIPTVSYEHWQRLKLFQDLCNLKFGISQLRNQMHGLQNIKRITTLSELVSKIDSADATLESLLETAEKQMDMLVKELAPDEKIQS